MKILIEGGDVNPPFAEGTRNIIITHAKELVKRGHSVSILTRKVSRITQEKLPDTEVIDGITFYRWENYKELALIYRRISKDIDLVHFFAKGGRPKVYFRILKLLRNKPFIFTLLGLPNYSPDKADKIVVNALNSVDYATVTSKVLFKHLNNKVKNLVYAPFGVDFDKYNNQRQKRNLIIALREPTPEVVNAFDDLRYDYPNYKFMFNLATIEKSKFNDLGGVALLSNRFKLLKKDEDMTKIFNQTAVLVDLHDKDTFLECASPPLAIIEAMACGAKVISTDMPEVQEIITNGENGYLINNTYQEIRDTIKKLLPPSSTFFQLSKYNIKNTIKQYETIYQELLNFHKVPVL